MTPNTPGELAALNQKPSDPYSRPAVEAAMDALTEHDDSNPGDIQAVAERCIDLLKIIAQNDLERHHKNRHACNNIREAIWNLEAAERFLEETPFIAMNFDEEEV